MIRCFPVLTIFFLIGCFFISSNGRAQSEFKKGYAITQNNDTLYGDLKNASIFSNCRECFLKRTGEANATIYKPSEIKGYRYIDGKYFISQHLPGTHDSLVFAEFLVDGVIDLLYYVDSKENYYIRKSDKEIIRLDYTDTIVYIEGSPHAYESTRHIGILKALMADAPQLFNKIETIKEPNDRQMICLTSEYHDAVCPGNQCQIYRKTMPAFQASVNPSISYHSKLGNINPYTQFNLNILIQAPRFNDRFHLVTGFGYAEAKNHNNQRQSIVTIPVRFRYAIPKPLLKPHFELGWSFMHLDDDKGNQGIGYMLEGGAGLSLRLVKGLWLDLSVLGRTTPFEFYLYSEETPFTFSYSLEAGLIIEL